MTLPRTDWRGLASRMRGDLDRADLNGRARRLAEFAIKATLMAGRTRVVIPNRMDLCKLLQIGKTHVAEVSAALVSSRILSVKENADGWELLVFPDSSQWDVEWNHTREEMAAFLAMINRAPGQAQGELIEPPPSLARTLANTSAENSASYQNGNRPPAPVTKMVTLPMAPRLATPLAVNSKTVHSITALKQLGSEQLTGPVPNENEVMDRLKLLVGVMDVEQWGGDWRKNWLRKHPRAFTNAIETLISERKEGWQPKKSVGAALKDLTKRYAQAK